MTSHMKKYCLVIAATWCVSLAFVQSAAADPAGQARQILDTAGVKGGLIVHVGCGDGRLTAALRVSNRYIVHGLDTDAANIAKAREHIRSLGIYGPVRVDCWEGKRLPFIDNLVNLIVASGECPVTDEELMRVLAPNGVALFLNRKLQLKNRKLLKPRPEDIDEWTHYLHDAGGNAVARDARVGPPRHMQWLGAPLWCRNHHTLASISSVVSAQGRTFYILDESTAGSMAVPGRWSVIARDAFSGVLLWKKPMPSWSWYRRGFRSGPVQLPRTLVAVGDRVYVPLGLEAPVSALDAATGETIRTYEGTERVEEIVVSDGVLLALVGSPMAEQSVKVVKRRRRKKGKSRGRRTPPFSNQKTIMAIRAETGKALWSHPQTEGLDIMPLTLAAQGGRVFFQEGKSVACLDLGSGKELWRTPSGKGLHRRQAGWSVATLVAHGGVVLWADGSKLTALSAEDGKALWECPCKAGAWSPSDVFVIEGQVWLGPMFSEARNLRTGKVEKTNAVIQDLWTAGHHHRCYREKATERYIMTGKRGVEFFDLVSGVHSRNNWVRGTCQYGVLPANGLLYAPSHACGCYMEAKLFGFWALAADGPRPEKITPVPVFPVFERGLAYGQIRNPQSEIRNRSDWPTFRRDPVRSGSTPSAVPAQLKTAWKADIGGRLTQPVVAGGMVVVSSIDDHRVVALDAASGDVRWTFTAGGRVDSPPTLHEGLALFGCADGWVYCLRASDGALAWRFRAAPADRCAVAMDQVESLWPVHGGVLVLNGVAYVSAGRSSYLDGGIFLCGLDPRTGNVLCRARVQSDNPQFDEGVDKTVKEERIAQNTVDSKTLEAPDRSDSFSMAGGAITDVLVSDGSSVYMRQVRFDPKLVRQEGYGRHLFSTTQLIDGTEVHRSHWMLGTADFRRIPVAYSWIANSQKNPWKVRFAVPYGLLLAFDDQTAWGVRRYRGYTLFAQPNRPFSPDEKPLPDCRPAEGKTSIADWQWSVSLPMRPRSLVRAGDRLILGGMPDRKDFDSFEGRKGGVVQVMSAVNGEKLGEQPLDSPPVWDGIAASGGRLYISTEAGRVVCME
ncbi:MAG: PQQ-binding-like beta-propeller repeat protein [Planctomycetes bacterium]|nr:PQQ-binding-like beta-propeller repeat protein [Planctomycetota bacterium]